MDYRQYIPGHFRGELVINPHYAGDKFDLFKPYPCKVLVPLNGIKKYMKSENMFVYRSLSGQLRISEYKNGKACFTKVCFKEAIEGVHFVLK